MPMHPMLSRALIAIALLLAAMPAGAAEPPTPAEIAQHCIARIATMTAHRVERNADLAEECVGVVAELLEQGREQQAAHVAGHCIHRIRQGSAETRTRILHRSMHCRAILVALGAPGLAAAVGQAAETGIAAVAASRQEAVALVEAALGG